MNKNYIKDYVIELENKLPEKLATKVTVIGGVLIDNGRINNFNIYSPLSDELLNCLGGAFSYEGVELEVVDSLATDDYEDNKGTALTTYLINRKNGFVKGVGSYIKKLSSKGIFIAKLAIYYDREARRDLEDLSILYEKFGEKIPKKVMKVIDGFGLQNCLNEFLKEY